MEAMKRRMELREPGGTHGKRAQGKEGAPSASHASARGKMRGRVMGRAVERLTVAEIRHELEVLPVWIRDVTRPKKARIKALRGELERRNQLKGELGDRCRSGGSD